MDIQDLSKTYIPTEIEADIYKLWMDNKAFTARPDARPADKRFVVMMPLPNVTGALHMGHATNNTIQDLLTRWHRMRGFNALWMPGTDHAGIATQAVVEKRLKQLEGKTRHDLGREALVERIWQWKKQYEARIISQQQKLGCSCDWDKHRFTMDKVYRRAVRHTFFRLFRDGLIFRGKRLVNWDMFLRTTISDDEMYYKKVQGSFWYLKYPIINPGPGEPEYITVATTRPETMLGDTAVAVHPAPDKVIDARISELEKEISENPGDESLKNELQDLLSRKERLLPLLLQYRDMARANRMVRLPLVGREIPIICDEWAKPEKGTGCVKITPAHDYNDYEVYQRHTDTIEIINIFNPDGTLNGETGGFENLKIMEAREKVLEALKAEGFFERVEEHEMDSAFSERSDTQVEPFFSDQWFIKMEDDPAGILMGRGTDKEFRVSSLAQAAMDAVIRDRVVIHPEKYKKSYLNWLAEKRNWPISRQLWWGHQIPIWSRTFKCDDPQVEGLLSDLRQVLEKNPEQQQEIHLRLISVNREINLLIDLATYRFNPGDWEACQELFVDACLLSDNEELLGVLTKYELIRDPDVLDTWFSSALFPHATLGWPDPATAEVNPGQDSLGAADGQPDMLDYYYPGTIIVTARDIITLWISRMVLAGLYNLGDIPFSRVFVHANILDGKGERMSKSKGNGIDPVDIINAYGADALRYTLCDMQTGNQDIRLPVTAVCPVCGYHNDLTITAHGNNIFYYICGKNENGTIRKGACGTEFDVLGTMADLPVAKLISEKFELGKAFCTKLWNSARFIFMKLDTAPRTSAGSDNLPVEDRWIITRLNGAIANVTEFINTYSINMAINAIRDFFWADFCDWYLEVVKPRLQGEEKSKLLCQQVLTLCLDQILRLLHPFIPFITEKLWQILNQYTPSRGIGNKMVLPPADYLISASWPTGFPQIDDQSSVRIFNSIKEIVKALRDVRLSYNISNKQPLTITIRVQEELVAQIEENAELIRNLEKIETINVDPRAKRQPNSAFKLISTGGVYIHEVIDDAEEMQRLKANLAKTEKLILACRKKLENPAFMNKAPREVVQKQQEILAEHENNKQVILENLKLLEL